MKYNYLEVWVEEHVAHVLLNNPENQNYFDAIMSQELMSVAREISEREDIKAIVLGSRGDNFSPGLNSTSRDEPEDEEYATVTLASAAITEWSRLPYPIVAALNGECSSLGLSLSCIADIRYASETALFSIPEATRGLVPAGGITQRLPRIIGKGPAMSMLLDGESIKAKRAHDLGLVTLLFDSNDLVLEEACKKAKGLANMSTLSMQYTKECLLRGSELPLDQALRLEIDMYMLLQTSNDRMEGVNAFLEKRSPNFKGE